MMNNIVIDPTIRFGKPTIKGTRVTVEEVIGALAGGMDFTEITKEYGLTKNQILLAVKYVAGWMQGEVTQKYEMSARC